MAYSDKYSNEEKEYVKVIQEELAWYKDEVVEAVDLENKEKLENLIADIFIRGVEIGKVQAEK